MTTKVTDITVKTFSEGNFIFQRAIVSRTASGLLVTGCDQTGVSYSRYFPLVKVKEISIDGNKKEVSSIQEDESI